MTVRTLFGILLLAAVPAIAADADFNGRWDITVHTQPRPRAWWVELTGVGSPKPAGKFVSASGGALPPPAPSHAPAPGGWNSPASPLPSPPASSSAPMAAT